jgi:hypothetical protein
MKKSANFAQHQYLRIFDVFVKSVLKNAVISKSDIGGSLRLFLANEREEIGVGMVRQISVSTRRCEAFGNRLHAVVDAANVK